MSRYASATDVPNWVEVSDDKPCPCCGASSGCCVVEDGDIVRCLKKVSDWPCVAGGWLHRLVIAEVSVDTHLAVLSTSERR
jgi:hypothetical protein